MIMLCSCYDRMALTAPTMFHSVDNTLENNSISWDYCLALDLDNTNVDIGVWKSILSRAKISFIK